LSFTPAGTQQTNEPTPANPSTFSLTTAGAGNWVFLETVCNTLIASSVSGGLGGGTWTKLTTDVSLSALGAGSGGNIWAGQVVTPGTGTVSVGFSGTPGTVRFVSREFTVTSGQIALDAQGSINSQVSAWPSLTPSGPGRLYWGYAKNNASAVAGSTSGFVYEIDSFSNGEGYCLSVSSAYQPVWGDSTQVVGVMVLVAEVTSGGVTFTPQRYGQAAPPSPAPWAQRDRRNANLVATAANPLPAPLDTAWQAGGRYWHLYGDTAARDRRVYFTQRPLVSDPSLLAGPANADPLALNPEQSPSSGLWRAAAVPAFYDRREVPQQRAYVSNPLLLATAELENELLGGAGTPQRYAAAAYYDRREVPQQPARLADPLLIQTAELENELLGGGDTGKRYVVPASHADRREVPQQRAYVSDPLLLATGLLENELLGGADTFKRYAAAATNAPRWWMPQQPPRLADPLLIATAELENELLGGGDTARHYLVSAWIDRREVPAQRPYISDPSAYPPQNNLDPLLAGAGYLDGHQHQAATHYDRREVPAQRAYVSDPSFYPLIPPTDPLTVAWGAGGVYWHLYHQAEDVTDRREVPQQRAYVSDPLLLATGLLENELLGGGDTTRHWLPAAYCDRRQVPAQRAAASDQGLAAAGPAAAPGWPLLAAAAWPRPQWGQQRLLVCDPGFWPAPAPLDPLLAGPPRLTQLQAVTHYGRRLVPAQRLYWAGLAVAAPPPSLGYATAGTYPAASATAGTYPAASAEAPAPPAGSGAAQAGTWP
jgi:hypothetical protein